LERSDNYGFDMPEPVTNRFGHPIFRFLLLVVVTELCGLLLYRSGGYGQSFGALTLLLLAVTLILILLILRETFGFLTSLTGYKAQLAVFSNLMLIVGAVMVCLIVFESGLWLLETIFPRPKAESRIAAALPMPAELRMRKVEVPGAAYAYYWQGKLHAHNRYGLRRVTPYPEKRKDTFRIMILGDSFTYGYGVADKDTYVRILERELSKEYNVEVMNFGFCGANGPQLLRLLKYHVPLRKPDLIVYGICINDYLPFGRREYDRGHYHQYDFPLPDSFKSFMTNNTRVGEFLAKEYDALLMRLNLRYDFLSAITHDFDNYRTRFAKELVEMNKISLQNGSGPILAMVLENAPSSRGRRHDINRLTEQLAAQAGMMVVPIENYEREYSGRTFEVSPWEGHPNERAHKLFAELLLPAIKNAQAIKRYKKSVSVEVLSHENQN
jgi:lysophospholipase L1-like esterase